jgi:phosphonate transport system substrate-binding protein
MTGRNHTAGTHVSRLASLLLAGSLTSCGEPPSRDAPSAGEARRLGVVLTVGDIDPDTPTRRIRLLQPLADHVAHRLASRGVVAGRVRIATDIEEMATLLRNGAVDYYVDSAFPSLRVRQLAGSRILLRRWVLGEPEYRSAIVARADAAVGSIPDLEGGIIAMQERYSTSGFLLPALELIDHGFELREVETPAAAVAPGEVGYLFSRDEENTVEMVLRGAVAAGVLSSQILDKELPEELRESLRVVHWTPWTSRALVSVRSDLDPALVEGLRAALLEIDAETNARLEVVGGEGAWSWKFDDLGDEERLQLEALESRMALAIGD